MTFLLWFWNIVAHVILFFFGTALFVYWWVMDHSDPTGDDRPRYRRPSQPSVAQEIDPLLRRRYERNAASR